MRATAHFLGTIGKNSGLQGDGNPYCWLNICCDKFTKNGKVGQWYHVTFYGNLANIVAQYGEKGRKVFIQADITTKDCTVDGKKSSVAQFTGRECNFVSSLKEEAPKADTPWPDAVPEQPSTRQPSGLDHPDFEEEPF